MTGNKKGNRVRTRYHQELVSCKPRKISELDFSRSRKSILRFSRRSQVTIFIIVAIVIVAAIALLFLLAYRRGVEFGKPNIQNPDQYIEKCAGDAATEAVGSLMRQGGWINPENYKLYQDDKIAYICWTNAFYQPCQIQEPLFIQHLGGEIDENITGKVNSCFSQLKSDLEKQGYGIEMGDMQLKTELGTGIVKVNIARKFVMSKNGETRKFENFQAYLSSPIYSLAVTAQEIANQEAKFCNFEYLGFMMLYPEFSIDKKQVGSGMEASKIYVIADRYTGKKLNIAVRSCEIPPGF